MSSKSIEDFLAFLRDAERQYNMAVQDEKEANNATQDILHAVELDTYNPRKTSKLVKTLRTIRKSRRAAKDTMETFSPVLSWLKENRATVKTLERLLGDVRKAERRIEDRIYFPKTDIMEAQ